MEGEILEKVLEVDSGEVGVEKGEDNPVRVAGLVHQGLDLSVHVIVMLGHWKYR